MRKLSYQKINGIKYLKNVGRELRKKSISSIMSHASKETIRAHTNLMRTCLNGETGYRDFKKRHEVKAGLKHE